MNRQKPLPQEIYRHFKGKLYQIITVAIHSETKEELVIYQALYDTFGIYARPLKMFMSEVEHDKYPDVLQKYRFEKVEMSAETEKQETETVEQLQKDNQDNLSEETKNQQEKVVNIQQQEDLNSEERTEELQINPDLIRFLDAETLEEKRRILIDIKTRLTDRLIDDIAASIDVTVEEGPLESRYKDLLFCVDTLKRFEVERLRL